MDRHSRLKALLVLGLGVYAPAGACMGSETLFFSRLIELDASFNKGGDIGYTWDAQGWYGGDFNKLWVKTEGEYADGELDDAELQVLYSRYLDTFWDIQTGLRRDFAPGAHSFVVLGIQGLAPYFFEVDTALFFSEEGVVHLRAEVDYELLITQKLIAELHLESNLFSADVEELEQGAGLANIESGLKLRYEITREVAPYLDINYDHRFGETADMARDNGEDAGEFSVRLGLRLAF